MGTVNRPNNGETKTSGNLFKHKLIRIIIQRNNSTYNYDAEEHKKLTNINQSDSNPIAG